MAKANDLGNMTYAELSELRDSVDAAMIEAKSSEKKSLRAKMEALAGEFGLTIDEVLGSKRGNGRGSTKGSTVAVKYRNPKDETQTWSGRGRRPLWLAAAAKKGQNIETFLV